MTLVVVGLDAADYRLANEWDLDNLLLETHGHLETFAHSREYPITAEVWPAIATGRLPDDGGAEGKRGSDWSGAMAVANRLGKLVVPQSWRTEIGRYLRLGEATDAHFGPTDGDHVFGDGAVYNWPGVTPAKNWSRSEWWLDRYNDGALNDLEFLRRQLAFTGEELGWATAMARSWLPVVGTRCHVLDHAGHAWAEQPEKLRTVYERVDGLVGTLRAAEGVDEVVVCSDHGMQTSVTGDDDPGTHSWESMVATSGDGVLPDHVADVRSWLEARIPAAPSPGEHWTETTMDTPTEHLKDLGYIQQ